MGGGGGASDAKPTGRPKDTREFKGICGALHAACEMKLRQVCQAAKKKSDIKLDTKLKADVVGWVAEAAWLVIEAAQNEELKELEEAQRKERHGLPHEVNKGKMMDKLTRAALEMGRTKFFEGVPDYVANWWRDTQAGKIKEEFKLKVETRKRQRDG